MKDIMNLLNKICLPIALFGAINYGLIGVFATDLLGYLDGGLIQIAQIIIGIAGVFVACGMVSGKK